MVRTVILTWLLLAPQIWAATPLWQPARTWVFAVGVLQFDSPNLETYPEEGRVDAQMVDAIKTRGVPDEQIVFIRNEQATKSHIAAELVKLLRKTGQGDTLLFYYTGHGSRDYSNPARPVSFVTYDTKSNWTVGEMFDLLEAEFKGSQALLLADCCHSGGLAEEAARRASRIGYGVLASAQPTSVSTSNWTFTKCLADLFSGSPAMDLDSNGEICFHEASEYCDAEMCFCEDQRACSAAHGSFGADLVLARSSAKSLARIGEHCDGECHGIWMKAKIVDAQDGKFLARWVDRPKKRDSWLTSDQLRKHQPAAMEAGQRVQVEWHGVWYKGQILETRNGLHLVHYDGFPRDDDEWVPLRRLRPQP
jgi:hypothetical protein